MLEVRRHPTTHKYVVAVDFDGTLCENAWPLIGEPKQDLIDMLKEMQTYRDIELILHTSRTGEPLLEAVRWCREQGLRFDKKVGGKEWASLYIDDKGVNPWDKTIAKILKDMLTTL